MACIDNGASIVDALQNLGRPWISCLGHNLHLVVSHGLDSDKHWGNPFNLSWLKQRALRKAVLVLVSHL